jgi:hypothetical protein
MLTPSAWGLSGRVELPGNRRKRLAVHTHDPQNIPLLRRTDSFFRILRRTSHIAWRCSFESCCMSGGVGGDNLVLFFDFMA